MANPDDHARPLGPRPAVQPAGDSVRTRPSESRLPGHSGAPSGGDLRPRVDPATVTYFDLVTERLALTADELDLLQRTGFVVSDRLSFTNMSTAYAYFFWQDLPVLVTTDSLLQAMHASYDDLLIDIEARILAPQLQAILRSVSNAVARAARQNADPALAPLYQDVATYVSVSLHLLVGHGPAQPTAREQAYLSRCLAANEVGVVDLFGNARPIDWTQWTPRGHYARGGDRLLSSYFRAMMWLSMIDFRLAAVDRTGHVHLQLKHLAAATILRDALTASGQRSTWDRFDALFQALIGRSDNMTLHDLDQFLREAALDSPTAILNHPDPDEILRRLTTNERLQQRITGQLLTVAPGLATPGPRPISLMLLGQRFAVDSYVMSNLVYDRLIVQTSKVKRALPEPLDVMYVLGNERAADHLEAELATYHYADALVALQQEVAAYPPTFWESSLYTRFLHVLRTLHAPVDARYPPTLRTPAWADKMLHTQLAAWSQARHDGILYVKHSYNAIPICTYPAGYVEPYPAFYAAVREYAAAGQVVMDALMPDMLVSGDQGVRDKASQYFTDLESIATRLEVMAEKEGREEAWTPDEITFIKTIAVQTSKWYDPKCTGVIEVAEWAGWYPRLFYGDHGESDPALIADIHTNAVSDGVMAPPRVLHVGTGSVATLIVLIETADGPTLYVGPALTYYQVVEAGWPPIRLNDQQWAERLASSARPLPPAWTRTFRRPAAQPPQPLRLPPPPGKRPRGGRWIDLPDEP